MATSTSKPVGYECEFVDQVSEDYFCKQCKHVAREPQIASCCIEVFCKACIEAVIKDEKPCPNCQLQGYSFIAHNRYRPKILALKVHCSLKDHGCEWTGQLQHLNAHLDLTTGDCVYVDVDCPKECNQKVQKCNVDTHLANHCPNRDYTCPHCSFKATFREVSEHFEVCRYYPLVCPNRCGASFERDVLEDHMRMCSLQKLQCEFSYAGCGAEFIRDDQKEHMEQNTQKHLALVGAATLRISQTFEQKLQEQQRVFDQKLEDKDSEIKAIVNNEASQLVNEQRQQSDKQIRELQEKLQKHQLAHEQTNALVKSELNELQEKDKQVADMLKEQEKVFEKKLEEQREEFHQQQKLLEEKLEEKDQQIKTLEEQQNRLRIEVGVPPYYITLSNIQDKKSSNESIISPSVYTHSTGHKFYLVLQPNGLIGGDGYNTHAAVWVCSDKGDHDHKLKFPARFTITLELLNQHRDQDHYRRDIVCEVTKEKLGSQRQTIGLNTKFISHTDLEWNADKQTQFLKNDCLKARITKIAVERRKDK